MTIKEARGELVMEWKTNVTTKEGIVIQFPRKFQGYKLATEEKVEENEGLKEQLQNIIPQIVTQVTANVNNANGGNGNGRNNGCSYKTFTVCNPKEFYRKGVQARGREAAIGISRKNLKALLVEEFCLRNEMEKLENEGTSMGWHLKSIICFKQPSQLLFNVILTAGILTDEAVHCGTLTKGNDKRKEMEESSKQWSTWKDNKKSKTGSGFVVKVPPRNTNEEIIPMESLCTHDSCLPIASKIDSLLEEFAGELTLLKSILPRIDETDCDFKEDIRLIKKLLYDNSSPRAPKEFVSANFDAKIKSFSPSPILVKDSDSIMEEIDLFCTPDYPMSPGIVDKDYDSKRDILIRKDLPSNNSLSFVEKESFHFDIPPFSRPPAKPLDGDT
nr:hypothetical protein [Tanacetum cinerariifolium]